MFFIFYRNFINIIPKAWPFKNIGFAAIAVISLFEIPIFGFPRTLCESICSKIIKSKETNKI
jgi:hypothetical protein